PLGSDGRRWEGPYVLRAISSFAADSVESDLSGRARRVVAHFRFSGRRNCAVRIYWSDLERAQALFTLRAREKLARCRVPDRIRSRHAAAFAAGKPFHLSRGNYLGPRMDARSAFLRHPFSEHAGTRAACSTYAAFVARC